MTGLTDVPQLDEIGGRARARPRSSSALPEEIIRRAIALFNRDGLANVSTNNIAADLGISSGNLHYHFHTKQDLSRAVYDVMEADLRHALRQTDTPTTVPEIVAREMQVQRCLWEHRYFFAGLDFMVRKDTTMLDDIETLLGWVIERIESLIVNYTVVRVLRPMDQPNTPLLVAQNMWRLWSSWVQWEVLMSCKPGAAAVSDDEVIRRLTYHNFSFLAFLLPPALAGEVDAYQLASGPLS